METTQPTVAEPTPSTTKKCHVKPVKIIACVIGAFLVAIIIFAAGMGVGLRKARYSYQWGQNYERNFLGGRQGMMGGNNWGGGMMGGIRDQFEGRGFRNANGLAGTIISIADNNIVVKDKDGKENTVAVTDQTLIRSQRNNLKLSDLKQNDQVVVMGNPGDNGVINATLIRVFNSAATN